MEIDLSYATGLPPEKAIEYFESKGYTMGFKWHHVWEDAHAKSFTVAGIMQQDILEDIRSSLSTALKNGESFETWRNKLEPLLQAKGWMGKGTIVDKETGEISKQLAPHRLKTIYQTNIQSAMMAGRYQAQLANADQRPYWEYVAVMDNRTRPSHAAQNGQIYRYDDPFWNTFYPPNGWRCRCRVRTRSERDIERKGLSVSNSEGQLVATDQIINFAGDVKPTIAYVNPVTGKRLIADAGFGYNPGKSHLGNLGQHLLNRSAVAESHTAALAVEQTLSNPKLLNAVSSDFSNMVNKVVMNKAVSGEIMHVGALPVNVLDALKLNHVEPSSAVISVSSDNLLDAIKEIKKPLPVSFWENLPINLRRPSAVLLDKSKSHDALLFVFNTAEGKMVVSANCAKTGSIGDKETIVTNMITSGTIFDDQQYESLKGLVLLSGKL